MSPDEQEASRVRKDRDWDFRSVANLTSERARRAMLVQFPPLRDEVSVGQRVAKPLLVSTHRPSPAAEPWLNTRPDPIDFRDYFYEPSLIALDSFRYPEPLQPFAVRDQGFEGSCTGQALAAIVDLQNRLRLEQNADVPKRVSARMLYESARAFDEFADDGLPGSSLRGVLKGFFHNGVCDAVLAPYVPGDVGWHLDVARAKDARRVGLGAYFRLRHVLNHYHAALSEAGAILCSAVIHKNWEAGPVRKNGGRIHCPDGGPEPKVIGMHAFAIVGYDAKGFIILNSWGPDWGNCNPSLLQKTMPPKALLEHGRELPGMAHWNYHDWRANVVDAWVLRLTAPTALPSDFAGGAFGASTRQAGVVKAPTVPAAAIRGHYVNIDDGEYVGAAPYPSDSESVQVTADFLRKNEDEDAVDKRYEHLLFYAHGGLNTLDDAAARAAAMTPVFKQNRIYPVFYLWHTGAMESVGDIVQGFVDKILLRTHGISDLSDMLIEKTARPIGRPIWSEMKGTAERAFKGTPAAGLDATRRLLNAAAARKTHPLKVHFVGHSAGAIFLGQLLAELAGSADGKKLRDLVHSVSLFAPACTNRVFTESLAPLADEMSGARFFNVYNLPDAAERADNVASIYRKSLLYLVSNSFEATPGEQIAGMTRFWTPRKGIRLLVAGEVDKSGKTPTLASAATTHGGFDNDPITMNHLLNAIIAPRQVTAEQGGFSKSQLGTDTV